MRRGGISLWAYTFGEPKAYIKQNKADKKFKNPLTKTPKTPKINFDDYNLLF